jgi:EAL domain-containing protein (putative c-di-GMP-specific phosphodiesterase class I)
VIAEGVETDHQLTVLQTEGCLQGQGYYFSHPVEAARFEHLLHAGLPGAIQ